jgi:ABC-type antimicrobial peptide transport system permease subunit
MRTTGDAETMLKPIADEIRASNGDLALSTLRTIQEQTRQSLAAARASAILFMVLGGLALVLAVVGVYGVVAYSVARRQLEIGVRMALGSQPGQLVLLLVRRGLRLVAIGAAVGIAAAVGVTRFLAPLLGGLSPTDVQVFIVVPLVLLAVAFLAIYLPARKATRVDPMVVLRYE